MSFNPNDTLIQLRAEIAKLQAIEQALIAADSNEPARNSRVSGIGGKVISLSARRRWCLKKGGSAAELKKIESDLAVARQALEQDKATRRARVKAALAG